VVVLVISFLEGYMITHHKLAYNTAEAAKALGVSIRSLKRLEQRGLLRASNALRRKLYSHQELNRFLEETSR
jgi:DNA-directed RNA polymerase specialized sigma24 family protein